MSTEKRNVEKLKVYNSPIYRKKIKRMVEMVKTVRGIHGKIPKGPMPPLKATATGKEKQIRADAEQYYLSIDSIHYFATSVSGANFAAAKTADTTETPANEGSNQ